MIDFETFEKCINALESDSDYYDKCYLFGMNVFEYIRSDTELVNLLKIAMHDNGDYIGWWCYEKDFGTRDDMNCFDENEEVISLKTTRELYDFLVQNAKEFGGDEPVVTKSKIRNQENGYRYVYECPTCSNEMYIRDDNGLVIGHKYPYCPECGTKIRWKDVQ